MLYFCQDLRKWKVKISYSKSKFDDGARTEVGADDITELRSRN